MLSDEGRRAPSRVLLSRRWGTVAAGWAVVFAAVHLFWAVGGSAGLASSAGPQLAAERPGWFVAGGLWGVAGLLLIGAGLGILLTRPRTRGWLGRVTGFVGAAVGFLLLARAVGVEVLLLTGTVTVSAVERQWTLVLWNPWFLAGGVFFCLASLSFWRSASAAGASRHVASGRT